MGGGELIIRGSVAQLFAMDDNDRTHLLLTQIRADLQAIIALLPKHCPDLVYPLSRFVGFDWGAIGATVLERDRSGATLVSWGGRVYARRSPSNKFDAAIWFSRSVGKGSDGSTSYERLITFKQLRYEIEPVPEKIARHLVTPLPLGRA
jgi:hypothetical protein